MCVCVFQMSLLQSLADFKARAAVERTRVEAAFRKTMRSGARCVSVSLGRRYGLTTMMAEALILDAKQCRSTNNVATYVLTGERERKFVWCALWWEAADHEMKFEIAVNKKFATVTNSKGFKTRINVVSLGNAKAMCKLADFVVVDTLSSDRFQPEWAPLARRIVFGKSTTQETETAAAP